MTSNVEEVKSAVLTEYGRAAVAKFVEEEDVAIEQDARVVQMRKEALEKIRWCSHSRIVCKGGADRMEWECEHCKFTWYD